MKFKLRIGCWVMLIVTVLITVFILSNSLQGFETSKQTSDKITDSIVFPSDIPREARELFIRKSAHLLEFALLGASALCLAKEILRTHGKNVFGFVLFYVLAVAVLDEHIQSFSDRTSTTGDIILDFVGALIGFAMVLLACGVYHFVKRKTKKQREV